MPRLPASGKVFGGNIFLHFWAPNWPFWGNAHRRPKRPKTGPNGSKSGKSSALSGSKQAQICPNLPCIPSQLCVCLGHFEGWKLPKLVGRSRKKCPRNRDSGRPAQDTFFLVLARLHTFAPQTAINGPKRAQTGVGRSPAGFCGAPTVCPARPIGHEALRTRTGVLPARSGAVWDRVWPIWAQFGPVWGGGTPARSGGAARS